MVKNAQNVRKRPKTSKRRKFFSAATEPQTSAAAVAAAVTGGLAAIAAAAAAAVSAVYLSVPYPWPVETSFTPIAVVGEEIVFWMQLYQNGFPSSSEVVPSNDSKG